MARRIELFAGIAAGVVGVAMLLFALFGPTGAYYSEEVRADGTRVVTTGTSGMWESQDFSIVLILFLAVMTVSLVGIAIGSWAHATSGSAAGFTLLWTSTVALALGSLLSLLSIGVFFMPSVLLAIAASVAASVRSEDEHQSGTSHA